MAVRPILRPADSGDRNEVACACGGCRRWCHGRGPALSPGARRLVGHRPDREGRADLGLDLACGGPVPALQRLAQHDQGACLWHRALSAARKAHRPGRVLARLRRPPPRLHRRGGELAQIRLRRLPAGWLRVRDHRTLRDQAVSPLPRHHRRQGRLPHRDRRARGARRHHQRHGGRCPPAGRRDRAAQPRVGHQAAAQWRVAGVHRAGQHRLRACGERGGLLLRRGGVMDRPQRADRQYAASLRHHRAAEGVDRPRDGASGGARPLLPRLSPRGDQWRAGRPLRDRDGPCLLGWPAAALGL